VPLKQDLFDQIEGLVAPDVIIASSTSAHPWSALSPRMSHPTRLITAHPFNPPHLIPLVELFGPDADVLDHAEALYRGLGQHPIRLNKEAVAHMAYHLGGGDGGMAAYLDHLGPSQAARWDSLGTPDLSPKVCEKLVKGIEQMAAGRSLPELEAERDARLIALASLRKDWEVSEPRATKLVQNREKP